MGVVLADRDDAVMTGVAAAGNAAMIETAVGLELEKMRGIVAGIAFDLGRHVKLGFADSAITVVAFTAPTQHFTMVDVRNDVETEWRVAYLAQAARGHVILRLAANIDEIVVMAVIAGR